MNLDSFIKINQYNTQKEILPTPVAYLEKMINLFNKHAITSENINEKQWEKLQEIIDIKLSIEKILAPFDIIRNYELNIVGGSLRDIITGHEESINDYDIVISAENIPQSNIMELIKQMKLELPSDIQALKKIETFRINAKKEQVEATGQTWEKYYEDYIIEKTSRDFYFSKIINHLMIGQPGHICYNENNVREKYMNYHINSINQFNFKDNVKVDLIVSEYSELRFLSTFDIELCKIYADLKNINTKEQLLNNIIPTGSMLRDIEDKTLSINVIKFPKENLDYFFKKHVVKMIKKYPNYKINLFNNKDIQELTVEQKERWIYSQSLKLEVLFPEKNNASKKKKI